MKHNRILITGSAGRIGRAAVRGLTLTGHEVIGFDAQPTPGLPHERSLIGSLTDADQLLRACDGVSCIIHLAATADDARYPRGSPPDDGDNFVSQLVPNNIVGTYNVLEAARKNGIARVILASTGQLIDGHLQANNVPVTVNSPIRPRYLYACSKVFLEAIGQVYGSNHGIEVLAVRLGWCPRDAAQVAELNSTDLGRDVFLSPTDAGRFFTAAVDVERLTFYSMVYATSLHTHSLRYDLSETQRLLGWAPVEKWPTGSMDFS